MTVLLDQAHFDTMTGGDRALQAEIAGLFRGQVEAWTDACGAGPGWRDAVHTMKGSARGIGLAQLAALCEAAETAPEAEAPARLASVRAALGQALAVLDQFVADAA
ncbi:Hpt domain-containing protein [Terricaulis sp.]|uniref:Hpt domain-containing protein n=1 Tax=Terricaulis sp. TaxID=2768686 RepID=UPI0037830157